ncbi:MAG: DUF4105 domain-containing protein [Candidatus Wallbacteria bacterium]|nr:DUF4105 domain-containing protein [Candidatus Wallbacteria bacterium]
MNRCTVRSSAFVLLACSALTGCLRDARAQEVTPAEAFGQIGHAAAQPSRATSSPATFAAGDGRILAIQREWAEEQDPARFEGMALAQQPFRFDQRTPRPVHAEQRPGRDPVYYFQDVRWRQTERPQGAKVGRKAYFTTVRVDPEKVRAAYFCMKPFAPKFAAGHGAILLEFAPGGFTSLDGEEASGCVISYEAYLRVTQKYQMIAGEFSRKFRITYVVCTWRDFLMRSIQFNGSVVKRWKLKLSQPELRKLARSIGRTVMEDHSRERYNTTRNSCITAALELIDSAVPPERQTTKAWLGGLVINPGWALPVLADNVLRHQGLIEGRKVTFSEVPPEK